MSFKTKDLINIFKSCEIEGFKFSREIKGFSWKRVKPDRTERIIIGYRTNYDSFSMYTPIVDVFFNQVEDILNQYTSKYRIPEGVAKTTILKSMIDIDDVDYPKYKTEIMDEKSFHNVKEELQKIIVLGAIPFFSKFSTLQNVDATLSELDSQKISKFISGMTGIKIPLIKKTTNSINYRDSLIESSNFYKGEALLYPEDFKNEDKIFLIYSPKILRNITFEQQILTRTRSSNFYMAF